MPVQFNDTPGPQNLYEAGVMLVALAGALDEAMTELAAVDAAVAGDWLTRIRRNAVRAAKNASSPSGTSETVDALAVGKAVHLLQTLFDKVPDPDTTPQGSSL